MSFCDVGSYFCSLHSGVGICETAECAEVGKVWWCVQETFMRADVFDDLGGCTISNMCGCGDSELPETC